MCLLCLGYFWWGVVQCVCVCWLVKVVRLGLVVSMTHTHTLVKGEEEGGEEV